MGSDDYYKRGFDDGYGRNRRAEDGDGYPRSNGDIASYENGHRHGELHKNISDEFDREEG